MDICIPVFELSRTGGMERYTLEVGAELAHRGHSVTFLAPRTSLALPDGARLLPVRTVRSRRTLVRLIDFLSFGFRATRHVRRIGPHQVVYRPMGGSVGPGVVTAHSCHAAWVRARPRGAAWTTSLFDRIYLFQERATFQHPEVRLSTVSALCADQIAAFYGVRRASIAVAPPAVDTQTFRRRTAEDRRRAREWYDVVPHRLTIGLVANHADQCKRLDLMIKATAQLDATLLVAGHPDIGSDARHLAASAGADVRFLGLVDDMHRFYSALDVFGLPSILESYGMAAHEAMAVGVATVVSETCGIVTLLEPGRDALVVEHGDLAGLVEAIDGLRDEHAREAMAERGSGWAHGRSWSDVVDDLLPLLEAERDLLGYS